MKISELKQPYRRMAYYLKKNVNKDEDIEELGLCFYWHQTDVKFWLDVNYGNHPEITEEIKTHFPADFDFSGEEQPLQIPNNPIIQNRIYTQLAKEGRFNELPATCEFSEPVELEVWDDDGDYLDKLEISGKYKGFFVDDSSNGLYSAYQHAQLPTKKIDFTQFKTGDIVEVDAFGLYYGYLESNKEDYIQLSFSSFSTSTRRILKKDIKSITKIK